MRISDWSSDVCSSDLLGAVLAADLHDRAELLVEQRAAHVVGAVAAPAFERDVEPEVRAERHLAQRGEGAAVGAVVVGQQQAGLACVADQFAQPAQALRVFEVGRGAAEGVEALRQDRTAHALAPSSEEHTSELQSLMRIPYAVFCFKQKT